MDSSEIYNITRNRAQRILEDESPKDMDILDEIEQTMSSWRYTSDTDLGAIKQDIIRIIQHILEEYFNSNNVVKKIYNALHCIIFESLHDQLMPLIKTSYKREDMEFNEKCRYIRGLNINPSAPSTEGYDSLPFISAVVELSMLDIHLSPLEKLNCLCTTYDLIFAELKSSLISLASKYSDEEIVVPVVNNEEVISILVYVITRSKLLYFFSNLYFMRNFAQHILDRNSHLSDILKNYEIASNRLINLNDEDLRKSHKHLTYELNATDAIEMLNIDIVNKNNSSTLQDEFKNRYIYLISLCTEKNFIPTNI